MKTINILHLEDDPSEAELIKQILAKDGINSTVTLSSSGSEYLRALEKESFDLILSDSGVPGFSGRAALSIVNEKYPHIPFVVVSGKITQTNGVTYLHQGVADLIRKDELWRLAPSIEKILKNSHLKPTDATLLEDSEKESIDYNQALELLVTVVQKLSLARDLNTITAIVRRAARELTGADGATFVMKEKDLCYYADEDAIAPLWKGKRFPADICIGGWCMKHKQEVIIEDVYEDERIPIAAYQLTFIKSLAMVPIRRENPIGAIGVYWAKQHKPTTEEVSLIQALANTTSVAMENLRVYEELEERVEQRTKQLEYANKELEAFCYTLSHDLRNPLSSAIGFSDLLQLQYKNKLDEKGQKYLNHISIQTKRMKGQIEAVLSLYQLTQSPLELEEVNLSEIAGEVLLRLQEYEPERQVNTIIEDELIIKGDRRLLQIAIENLIANAWKYSSKKSKTEIEFRCVDSSDESLTFSIKDNGAGFDLTVAERLFYPFARMHSQTEFTGNGIGLASVKRIIRKHQGKIWAESIPEVGATFYFSLPRNR